MNSRTSTARGVVPASTTAPAGGARGTEPGGLARRLAALALIAILATQFAGCTVYPEVVRENLWAVEHPGAFED